MGVLIGAGTVALTDGTGKGAVGFADGTGSGMVDMGTGVRAAVGVGLALVGTGVLAGAGVLTRVGVGSGVLHSTDVQGVGGGVGQMVDTQGVGVPFTGPGGVLLPLAKKAHATTATSRAKMPATV